MRTLTQIESRLKELPKDQFPGHGKIDYWERYRSVAEYLERDVHPQVQPGTLVHGDGYLTDHGVDHILTVQRRAEQLLPPDQLEPYEVYLFLLATQVHDAGNIFGREGHESQIPKIQRHLGMLLGEDAVEQQTVHRIARAHTGAYRGDTDTLAALSTKEDVLGLLIRPQVLAALLRFADELADDSLRAARFPLKAGVLPKESEVFHQYARHLHSVRAYADTQTITLRFSFNRDLTQRKFGRGSDEVYLLDEIYRRSIKIHAERQYCMRYLVPYAVFHCVKVDIQIFESGEHPYPLKELGYRLQETGYPPIPTDVKELCPEVGPSGEELRRELDPESS